jgi:uncharacterized damage-inducible protein DinB
MKTGPKIQNIIQPLPHGVPEIGVWLWALEDSRQRTLATVENYTQAVLDWEPSWSGNNIATLLYHIAAVEVDWLYEEVLQQEFPAEIDRLFPFDMRDAGGQLSKVCKESLEMHIQRLAKVRANLLSVFSVMTLDEFRRPRFLPDYDVTPEWVLYHLLQHEAEHRGQIGEIKLSAERG